MTRLIVCSFLLGSAAPALAGGPEAKPSTKTETIVVHPTSEYLGQFIDKMSERNEKRRIALADAQRRLTFMTAALPTELRLWQRVVRMNSKHSSNDALAVELDTSDAATKATN